MNSQLFMVKDKTKDGAVPGMVENEVNKIDMENVTKKEKLSERLKGIEFIVCFILIMKMEIAVHMTGMEDVIDNPIRVGDKVSMNTKRKVEFQVGQCERQCQTNNLVKM